MGVCCSIEAETKRAELASDLEKSIRMRHGLRNNLIQKTANETPASKYEVIQQLGVGSMGSVDLVKRKKNHISDKRQHQRDREYALKTLRVGRITSRYMRELKNEINIVSDLDHPSIVKFYQVYYTETQIYVVMELCSGGDLYKREPYTESDAAKIVAQILSAVSYMHSRGYVHRDIKFENIMFESKESDKIKIIDFGLSGRYNPDRPLHAQYGTLQTMAPEVIKGEYNSKCDIWSVGVVAFELICGEKPFVSPSAFILQDKISNAEYSFSAKGWAQKSKLAKNFCRDLLQTKPEQRPTAAQALVHAWIEQARLTSNNRRRVGTFAESNNDRSEVMRLSKVLRYSKLMQYSKIPQLQKIASLFIAHKSFPQEVAELRALFEKFDTDKSGYISFQEFKEAFKQYNENETEIKAIFEGLDILHDGTIGYTEFLAGALTARGFVTEDKIVESFESLSVGSSGNITVDNLRSVMGRDFSEKEAKRIIDEIDLSQDGMVSLDEFIKAFRKNVDYLSRATLCQKTSA